MQLPHIDPACITSFFHTYSECQRASGEAMLVEATNVIPNKKNIWEGWWGDSSDKALDTEVACKQGRHLSPSSSWKVPAERTRPASPALQLQPHFSPSQSAESEVPAEDVGARAWASISVQQLPPLIDVPALAHTSHPVPAWHGNLDLLLGGEPCTAACAQTGAAAYRSDCQQLALRAGRLLTWAALLGDSE